MPDNSRDQKFKIAPAAIINNYNSKDLKTLSNMFISIETTYLYRKFKFFINPCGKLTRDIVKAPGI